MIKALITDDEKKARDGLANILTNYCANVKIIGQAANISEAEEIINNKHPELVFLDINMPGGSGFDLLKKIDYKQFKIVFVTAFDRFAVQAFRFNAFDYLLKPININQVIEVVERVDELSAPSDEENVQSLSESLNLHKIDKVVLNMQEGKYYLSIDDIVYLSSEGNYTEFYVMNRDQPYVVSKPVKNYEEVLLEKGFYRVHQSNMINLKYVEAFLNKDGGFVQLKNGTELGVSRRSRKGLLEYLEKDAFS